jgi:hypothetical protein
MFTHSEVTTVVSDRYELFIAEWQKTDNYLYYYWQILYQIKLMDFLSASSQRISRAATGTYYFLYLSFKFLILACRAIQIVVFILNTPEGCSIWIICSLRIQNVPGKHVPHPLFLLA